ncbi:MAG: hypothetical protein ACJ746_31150 [Bryobacteraceae bacterium]
MATIAAGRVASGSEALVESHSGLPWYLWCASAAVTSAVVGAMWDISWHESIGRDTFWTPAHVAIYMCGVLAGIAYGYLILSTTFSSRANLERSSVRIVGLRGPLGAFIASWGGIAMLTSAPFDNWWHDAYGLDVKILSPPHVVLFIGVYAILAGTLVLIAGHMNRATGKERKTARNLYLYVAGISTIAASVLIFQFTSRVVLHNSAAYIAISLLIPIVMAITSRATRVKHAATFVALFYMLFVTAMILILPLFPAEPKLGPVYQHVTHFVPPPFPLLLIIPGIVLDLFWSAAPAWNRWKLAACSAVLFVGSLVAVQYPFASFLMSPASKNAFFGTMYLPYAVSPASYTARDMFYLTDTPAQFWTGLGIAVLCATLATRFGIGRGEWMAKVQR